MKLEFRSKKRKATIYRLVVAAQKKTMNGDSLVERFIGVTHLTNCTI